MKAKKIVSKPKVKQRKPVLDRALDYAQKQLDKAKADYTKFSARAEKARMDIPRFENIVSVLSGKFDIGRVEPQAAVNAGSPVLTDAEAVMQSLGVKRRRSGELLADLPVVGAPATNDNTYLPDVD
jgi:hypothetical protein